MTKGYKEVKTVDPTESVLHKVQPANGNTLDSGCWVSVTERVPNEREIVWMCQRGRVMLARREGCVWSDMNGWISGADYWQPLNPPTAPNKAIEAKN